MKNTTLVTILFVSAVTPVIADDWPGIYGPRRNHTSPQKGLMRTWPQEGPKVLWTVPLGAGFGGPAVSGGNVYLLDRDEAVGDKLRVFDLTSGKELWSFAYDAPGKFMFAGSRSTPTVDGDHVYTVGALGDLHAFSTKTRKPVWRKNIWKDFGGGSELPRWAIVQNPLIYGDLLIVAAQTSEAGVVAYDKLTGEIKWKSPALPGTPGYVTPSIVKVAGEDHLVMITAAVGRGRNAKDGSVNGVDLRSGKVLWTYNGYQNIIPVTQAVNAGDGRILVAGAYGAGSVMIKIGKKGDTYAVSELFKNPDFGSHTQPPILHEGHFYSHYTINERSDGLVAMSMDGQVKWKTGQQPPFVRGGSILADGLLLMTDGNTKLYLVEPNAAAFKPLAGAVILDPGDNWAPLALVDGKLLVRGQKELKVIQVVK
ncbi:MAG: PQQ-like beta-propeller repeat protein [Acidobacteria bacterium]|nr:PQQ-like beta-propeller repeat protein [Acidobacteriota bacterium]